jgi:hypothetical protein
VHRGGFMDDETQARAVNAQPWEPMPGMTKRQCPECRYWFTALCRGAAEQLAILLSG